ncbi:hypothetical protein J2X46_003009 [Nocardioides sp. BE266]|uniref:hypothetical protein n=1 Tax=Nocardioides sp. BE266 TaxID=2817725 RepID=UPI00285F7CEB|nr:hypothetical protein [Nocardioides sp. BE266]MDR7254019.1 hypothetical protein [Nocardioides sp. BE266]
MDHVEYVVAFSEPFDFWVWLGTTTDSEREALGGQPDLDERIRRLAEKRGLGDRYEGVTVESQETVDRDYAGHWFYRLR